MIKEMYADKKFSEIIATFETSCNIKDFSEWEYFYYMNSLYKLGEYSNCLECYKEFIKKFPDSNMLNDKMGWAIYQLYFKKINVGAADINCLIKKADYAIKKSSESEYSPRWKLVKSVVDVLIKKNNQTKTDWEYVKDYLNTINLKSLSIVEKEYFSQKENKIMKLASDFEDWYSLMTRALLHLEEYEECILVCDEGLARINKFHYNNDIWFKYRKAKCLYALKRIDETVVLIEEVMAKGFNNGALLMLLYQVEVYRGNYEKALGLASKCSLFDKNHLLRMKFYEEFAFFLDSHNFIEEAMLHRRLVLLIRQEKEWNINSMQKQWVINNEIVQMSKSDVLKKLTEFWQKNKNVGREFLKGKIRKLLGEGKSGFISSETGKDYYFNIKDVIGKPNNLEEGDGVEFFVQDRFDKSKNQVGKVAVEIKML